MASFSRDLALVVGRVRPTDASFAAWEAVLSDLDRDDRVKRMFLAQRAEWLNNGSVSPRNRFSPVLIPWEAVRRPFDLHMVNEVADLQARYLEFADRPWPQRLDAFRDVDTGTVWRAEGHGRDAAVWRSQLSRAGSAKHSVAPQRAHRHRDRTRQGIKRDA